MLNCSFFYYFHLAPSLWVNSFEFLDVSLTQLRAESWGYPPAKIRDPRRRRSDRIECDGQVDGQTDISTVAMTALAYSLRGQTEHAVNKKLRAQKRDVSNAFLCSEVTFYRRNDLLLDLSPPKPTSGKIFYAHSEYTSACDRSTCAWRATPLSFDVSFLENPCEYPNKL